MSKKNRQSAPKAAVSQTEGAAPTPVEVKPKLVVVLKKDAKFRGARDKWYARLLEHDGKPVDDYVASCKANPPDLPKSGRAENPTGWVSYFTRNGIMETKNAA